MTLANNKLLVYLKDNTDHERATLYGKITYDELEHSFLWQILESSPSRAFPTDEMVNLKYITTAKCKEIKEYIFLTR